MTGSLLRENKDAPTLLENRVRVSVSTFPKMSTIPSATTPWTLLRRPTCLVIRFMQYLEIYSLHCHFTPFVGDSNIIVKYPNLSRSVVMAI